MNNKKKNLLECGVSMLEVVLAIGIMAVVAPLIYRAIEKQTGMVRNIAVAKEVRNMLYAAQNYMMVNKTSWSDGYSGVLKGKDEIEDKLVGYGMKTDLKAIWEIFSDYKVFIKKDNKYVELIIILNSGPGLNTLEVRSIASLIGPMAGYIEDNIVYGIVSAWKVNIKDIVDENISDALIIKVNDSDLKDSGVYLSRVSDLGNRMLTNLFMGLGDDPEEWHNINNVKSIGVEKLNIVGGEEEGDGIEVFDYINLEGNDLSVDNIVLNGELETTDADTEPLSILAEETFIKGDLTLGSLDNVEVDIRTAENSILGDIDAKGVGKIIEGDKINAVSLVLSKDPLDEEVIFGGNGKSVVSKETIVKNNLNLKQDVYVKTIRLKGIKDDSKYILDSDGQLFLGNFKLNSVSWNIEHDDYVDNGQINDVLKVLNGRNAGLEDLKIKYAK